MNKDQAFRLFEELIEIAEQKLLDFTLNASLSVDKKADKSVVTECDKAIDQKLTQICQERDFRVVSEEGDHVNEIVASGNYITIDPIDGTLGYIDYVNKALASGDIKSFLTTDFGPEHDFALLLGIVENGQPRFAACLNYITKEKILLDASDKKNLIRKNNIRNYKQISAVYLDQRSIDDSITNKILSLPEVTPIKQAALGLKSLYTVLNPHESAVTVHRVQTAGLWDILPAAVAAKAFGGNVYDDKGNLLILNKYIILPGHGATVIKGDKFSFVVEELKNRYY